jgi:DNA repair protein RadC
MSSRLLPISRPKPACKKSTGHRARLRERLLIRGPEALADTEILEMLLFLCIARRDTRPLAAQLLKTFGSLSGVLSASPTALAEVGGLGQNIIGILRLPEEAARRLAQPEPQAMPILDTRDRLLTYLDQALVAAVPGELRALLLDNRNRLLADERVHDAAEHVPHALAGRALTVHATALILIRVILAGTADQPLLQKEATLALAVRKAVSALSVVLHDHMLVDTGNWISLTQRGLL